MVDFIGRFVVKYKLTHNRLVMRIISFFSGGESALDGDSNPKGRLQNYNNGADKLSMTVSLR